MFGDGICVRKQRLYWTTFLGERTSSLSIGELVSGILLRELEVNGIRQRLTLNKVQRASWLALSVGV